MKKKFLVVEDEDMILGLIFNLLKQMSKYYEVITVADGYSALNQLKLATFSLVIVDYNIQNMDGLKLLSEIKKNLLWQPVIMMSGYADKKLLTDITKFEHSYFVKKPFELDELKEKTKFLLNGGRKNGKFSVET